VTQITLEFGESGNESEEQGVITLSWGMVAAVAGNASTRQARISRNEYFILIVTGTFLLLVSVLLLPMSKKRIIR
jgi:hypothetical protein